MAAFDSALQTLDGAERKSNIRVSQAFPLLQTLDLTGNPLSSLEGLPGVYHIKWEGGREGGRQGQNV